MAKGGRSEIFCGTFMDLIETLEALLEVAIVVENLKKYGFCFEFLEEDEKFKCLRVFQEA